MAKWQVTSPEEAAVAGRRREARPLAQLHGWQVPLRCLSRLDVVPEGLPASLGARLATQQSSLLNLGRRLLPPDSWEKRDLVSRLQIITLMPAGIFPCETNVKDFFSRILCSLLINHFGDP